MLIIGSSLRGPFFLLIMATIAVTALIAFSMFQFGVDGVTRPQGNGSATSRSDA